MRISNEIKLEQTQKLVMTPELQQAITLLQFSALELSSYLENELMENPVIELDNSEEEKLEKEEREENEENELDWDEYFQEQSPTERISTLPRQEENAYEKNVSKGLSLQEHLLFQLMLTRLSSQEVLIAEFIIGNIDQNGYLKGSLFEFSRFLGISVNALKIVLEVIQRFEPAGVGARSLQESLLIQLRQRKEKIPPLAEEVINNYLSQVAENRWQEIVVALGTDLSHLQKAVDFIRTLNPKPGCAFSGGSEAGYIIPDLLVKKVNHEYVIMVSEFSAPRLMINPYYRSILNKKKKDDETSFIKKRLDAALWLIKSIEQRRLTLYRVMEQIVDMQKNFFEKGLKFLKPLTLREIAERLDVHESTVSRATANKYAQTPRGVFPLKFFFPAGVETAGGESMASSSIKSYLKEIINKENPQKPFSDEKLARILGRKGISLARRTVTKYRLEMQIPSSCKRRRY